MHLKWWASKDFCPLEISGRSPVFGIMSLPHWLIISPLPSSDLLCVSQHRIAFAAVTTKPQISVAQPRDSLFLAHVTVWVAPCLSSKHGEGLLHCPMLPPLRGERESTENIHPLKSLAEKQHTSLPLVLPLARASPWSQPNCREPEKCAQKEEVEWWAHGQVSTWGSA